MKSLAMILWLGAAVLLTATTTSAQPKSYTESAEFSELLNSDLPTKKADAVSAQLALTKQEARVFWPLYKRYNEVIMALNKAKLALMKDYAASYDAITSAKTKELVDRALDIDDKRQLVRKKFYQEFTRALNARAAADLIQLDRRFDLLMDLQIASGVR